MEIMSSPHLPFAQLPTEARTLLYIFAVAAIAHYDFICPTRPELAPWLETVWNENRLAFADLSNPPHDCCFQVQLCLTVEQRNQVCSQDPPDI
jgi:hypothetical protein